MLPIVIENFFFRFFECSSSAGCSLDSKKSSIKTVIEWTSLQIFDFASTLLHFNENAIFKSLAVNIPQISSVMIHHPTHHPLHKNLIIST